MKTAPPLALILSASLMLAASPSPAPLPDASPTTRGVVRVGAQTFSGPWTVTQPDGGGRITTRNFIGTESDPASWGPDAGRIGNFVCPYVTNGVPCMSNPVGIVEVYGKMPEMSQSSLDICDVELYGGGAEFYRTDGCITGVGNGPTSHKVWGIKYDGTSFQDGDLLMNAQGGNETHLQARYAGLQIMGTHPGANGPDVYVFAGATRSSGNVFEVYNYPGTLLFSVAYDGTVQCTSSRCKGAVVLNGASPSVATPTVKAGAICTCSNNTTRTNAIMCSVASTTLTITGPNGSTDTVSYVCL